MTGQPQPSHLLVIDDDARIRELLKKYLVRKGFLVTTARDAAHARRLLEGLDFDLIVMDVMMPGEDGFSLTRDISTTRDTPIILLTARGDTDDRIKGLELGAEDYLAKPFEPKELVLRVNAILKRVPQATERETPPKTFHMGELRYDIGRGELWQGEALVRLTGTESALLRIFSGKPNEPFSRTELVEKLGRGEGRAQERAIDVQITRLRRKLGEDPKQPRYIQTVRGSGYMLVPD